MFVTDFETALIAPGLQAPPPVCMSAVSESSPPTVYKDWVEPLTQALRSDQQIIGLNIAFDLAVACADRPELFELVFRVYDEDRITDVAIRQKLIDIAAGEYRQHGKYSLASLSKRLLDRHLEKEDTWRLRYWELIDTPLERWPQEAIEYSEGDVIAPRDIWLVQERDLAEVDRTCVLADQYRQSRAEFALHLASAWGMRADAVGVGILRKECEDAKERLEPILFEAGLLRHVKKKGEVSVSKCVRKVQAHMLSVCSDARLTKKGLELEKEGTLPEDYTKYISVDKEACSDSNDPLLEQYSEYNQFSNLLTGQVKALEQGVGRPIHTRFEVLLDTGRTSSSGPNIQNVRRKEGARECFVPRDGWVFVDCDFDRAELHTLAQVCINLFGRSVLGDALNSGYDPHTGLGARLANMSYDQLKAEVAAENRVAKGFRSRAKPGNFGFPGGMGPRGMQRYAKAQYGQVLTLEETEALYRGWQEQWPVVAHEYLEWIRNLVSGVGHATIEHFDSKRWRGRVSYCVAANSFFQGMAADAMKAALWAVIKKCYMRGTALYGCRVVNEIHDEFLLEAPAAIASDAAWELRDTMVAAYNTYTRDVPVSATPALMDRWSKGAKTLIDKNGNLEVWRYAA